MCGEMQRTAARSWKQRLNPNPPLSLLRAMTKRHIRVDRNSTPYKKDSSNSNPPFPWSLFREMTKRHIRVYSNFRNYAPPLDEKGGIITEKVFPVFSENFVGAYFEVVM